MRWMVQTIGLIFPSGFSKKDECASEGSRYHNACGFCLKNRGMSLGRIPRHVQMDVDLVADAVRIHGGILNGIGFLYVSFRTKPKRPGNRRLWESERSGEIGRGLRKRLVLQEPREGQSFCLESASGVKNCKALPVSWFRVFFWGNPALLYNRYTGIRLQKPKPNEQKEDRLIFREKRLSYSCMGRSCCWYDKQHQVNPFEAVRVEFPGFTTKVLPASKCPGL